MSARVKKQRENTNLASKKFVEKKTSKGLTVDEEREIYLAIAETLASVDDPSEVTRIFEDIFTERERHNFALRWRLMELLHSGMTQRAISEELGVSLCKITRGSHILKNKASVVPSMVAKRVAEKQKKDEHFR